LNKYLTWLFDTYALMSLHKNKSKASHFYIGIDIPPSLDEIDTFYPKPDVPEVTFELQDFYGSHNTGRYKYKSMINNNDTRNNYSTGKYFTKSSRKQPVSVILVHGWRMDSFDRIYNIYLEPFMELDYNIYSFTLPHHFERTSKTSLYNGELMVSANIDRTLLSVKQAITDLRALIRYLKEKNEKVILIGVSLGGFLTNLTACIEQDIDILISVMYANSLAFSVWKSIPGKYLKRDFKVNGFTYEDLKKYWAITEPSNFKPVIPKENILLISGIYDKYVLNEDTDYLWESWDKPNRLLYPCGHSGIVFCRDRIRKDSLHFINKKV
jgi:pimeloyl-ACP methyl ester carboxylesterase